MSFLNNLSIKHKIFSTLFLILGLELVVAALAIYFLSAIKDHTDLVDVDVKKMVLATRVNTEMLEIHRAQKNMILLDAKEDVEIQRQNKNRYIAELNLHVRDLDRLTDRLEWPALADLNSALDDFLRVDREITTLLQQRNTQRVGRETSEEQRRIYAEVVGLSVGQARQAYNRASELIRDVIRRMEKNLEERRLESSRNFNLALVWMLLLGAVGLGFGCLAGLLVTRKIAGDLDAVVSVTDAIARGKLDTLVAVEGQDEIGWLAASVKKMQSELLAASNAALERDWIKTGLARVNDAMHGRVGVADLSRQVAAEIATYMEAAVGAVFIVNQQTEPVLEFAGGYAYANHQRLPERFHPGEGLLGQALLERAPLVVQPVPPDYVKVCSGLGDACPDCIVVAPLVFEDQVKGVIELGFFKNPLARHLEYLRQALPAVAITLHTVQGREQLAESLARSQVLTEELQRQQDEIQSVNEELEEQAQRLKQSEDRLLHQQSELEEINAQLEEKNEYLQRHKEMVERINHELEQSRAEIEEKAGQLAQADKYKSEFLANMSHELRTPLNSILLLSRLFCDNKEGNLVPEQIRSAQIIYSSGNDLLTLINEVLDLAKIEAGRMELHAEPLDPHQLVERLRQGYSHMTAQKHLHLEVLVRPHCPPQICTDAKRVDQILRNLISNAVKFTEEGGLRIEVGRPLAEEAIPPGMSRERTVAIAVTDTGPGIPENQQQLVFEAFRQLDAGVARKYGGTGLGLSISRNLAHLLGGNLWLRSQTGKGSTFTLFLPDEARFNDGASPAALSPSASQARLKAQPITVLPDPLPDDRAAFAVQDEGILIIEDDLSFAEHLIQLCRARRLKVLHAVTAAQGLALAAEYLPKGILLDLRLPDQDGWAVLDALKEEPRTRHIPVHIVSIDEAGLKALSRGAVGFLTKPVRAEELEAALAKLAHVFQRNIKDLLVVEDDLTLRQNIVELIGNGDVQAHPVGSAAEAMALIRSRPFDCMILDMGLPDMNGLEMLRRLEKEAGVALPPVIIYTGRELSREEAVELEQYSESIIIKGVRSEERLFDEASLFLHRIVEKMPARKRRLITNLYDTDTMFKDKTVLMADDDMRSVFALSKVLEAKGLRVLKAENGSKALELLQSHGEIDLVLMDMMMPVMDGYEAIRRIRAANHEKLPIIALTAKAMKSDRERCIQAGASDYLAKPVDISRLLSMMRVWMYR